MVIRDILLFFTLNTKTTNSKNQHRLQKKSYLQTDKTEMRIYAKMNKLKWSSDPIVIIHNTEMYLARIDQEGICAK